MNKNLTCFCCRSSQPETLQHVFVASEAAFFLWNTIGNPLGITHNNEPIISVFKKWWNITPKNKVHQWILHTAPIFICYELWKQRCACRYGSQKKFHNTTMMVQGIWCIRNIVSKLFLPFNTITLWTDFCDIAERIKPIQKVTQVKWSTPHRGTIKVNTDGSFLLDTGSAGIGGIARDSNGEMVMAFSIPVACTSNNMAEALAAEFGGKWCRQQGLIDFTLEMDSMIIVNMVINKSNNNFKLRQIIDNIIEIVDHSNGHVTHCFRESNQVADFLAKRAARLNQTMILTSFRQLPGLAKGAYFLDKCQMPCIRTKFDKANFFVS